MKNSVFYADCWLTKGSRALELYADWKKVNDPKLKKLLDAHMKDLDVKYKLLTK